MTEYRNEPIKRYKYVHVKPFLYDFVSSGVGGYRIPRGGLLGRIGWQWRWPCGSKVCGGSGGEFGGGSGGIGSGGGNGSGGGGGKDRVLVMTVAVVVAVVVAVTVAVVVV